MAQGMTTDNWLEEIAAELGMIHTILQNWVDEHDSPELGGRAGRCKERADPEADRGGVMAYESRSLNMEEALPQYMDDPGASYKTLRVSEHEDPLFLRLEIMAVGADEGDEPEASIVVDIGVLRGFLTWLRDGDPVVK